MSGKRRRHEPGGGVERHECPRPALGVLHEGEQLGGGAARVRRLLVLVRVRARAGHAVGQGVERHHEQAHAGEGRPGDGASRVVAPERREVAVGVGERRQGTGHLDRLALLLVEQDAILKRCVIERKCYLSPAARRIPLRRAHHPSAVLAQALAHFHSTANFLILRR